MRRNLALLKRPSKLENSGISALSLAYGAILTFAPFARPLEHVPSSWHSAVLPFC